MRVATLGAFLLLVACQHEPKARLVIIDGNTQTVISYDSYEVCNIAKDDLLSQARGQSATTKAYCIVS